MIYTIGISYHLGYRGNEIIDKLAKHMAVELVCGGIPMSTMNLEFEQLDEGRKRDLEVLFPPDKLLCGPLSLLVASNLAPKVVKERRKVKQWYRVEKTVAVRKKRRFFPYNSRSPTKLINQINCLLSCIS